jgi:hypothetical protein
MGLSVIFFTILEPQLRGSFNQYRHIFIKVETRTEGALDKEEPADTGNELPKTYIISYKKKSNNVSRT